VIWTSADGDHWAESAVVSGFLLQVVRGGPGFIGVGSQAGLDNLYGALAWSSPDGTSWTESPTVPAADGAGMLGVLPFEGGFLAVGASRDEVGGVDGRVWRSDDGVVWRASQTATLEDIGLSDVRLSHGRLLAASWTTLHTVQGELDRTGISTSQDGSNWLRSYAPECCGQMLDIVNMGDGLLALYRFYVPDGQTGVGLLRSTDGTSWEEIGAPPVEEGVLWDRLRNGGGSLGVIGLALQDIGGDQFQPLLMLPPPDLFR
jgi:hypothetical protein